MARSQPSNRSQKRGGLILTTSEVNRLRHGVDNSLGEFYGRALYSVGFIFNAGTNEVRKAIEGQEPYNVMPSWVHKPVRLRQGLLAFPENEKDPTDDLGPLGAALYEAGVTTSELNGRPRSDVTNVPTEKVRVWGRRVGEEYAHLWRIAPNFGGLIAACGKSVAKADMQQFFRSDSPPLCVQCATAHQAILAKMEAEKVNTEGEENVEAVMNGTVPTEESSDAKQPKWLTDPDKKYNPLENKQDRQKKVGTREWKGTDIEKWLWDRLKEGPVLSDTLYDETYELGISGPALKKAKQHLGVRHTREGRPGRNLTSRWYREGTLEAGRHGGTERKGREVKIVDVEPEPTTHIELVEAPQLPEAALPEAALPE